MKKQTLKNVRRLWVAIVVCITISSFGISTRTEAMPDEYHHHIQSFGNSGCNTATEMGYSMIASSYGGDCRPPGSSLGLIANSNGKVGPIRLYENGGNLQVMYQWWFETEGSNLNSFATMKGLNRVNGKKYTITQADLDVILHYHAAKADTSGITLANASWDSLSNVMYFLWVTGSAPNRWCNLRANLRSKKVVNDIVTAQTLTFPWSKYDAFFWDSMGDDSTEPHYNASWGGQGSYSSWKAGQLDMTRRISAYARNTALTGKTEPMMMIINCFQLKRKYAYTGFMKWYADNTMRFDHYYYEKGTDNSNNYLNIDPNGVVPGTNEPAYVDPLNPTGAYLPASLVQLDNIYTGVSTFASHLNACGTAGLYGSWFGWYGEDNSDAAGYTNDLKLLRAIPNWDNLANIPVPDYDAFGDPNLGDQRKWNGSVYWSTNSGASSDVIYSINPINGELYIVFKTLNGVAYLPANTNVKEGFLVDEDFAKTETNALPCLEIVENRIRLKPEYSNRLNTGIRLSIIRAPKDLMIK